MKKFEKDIKEIITKWVGKNFGTQEMEDPSWDIGALSEEIAKHATELFWDIQNQYAYEDVSYVAEHDKVYLTPEQKKRITDMYVNSDCFGEIDYEAIRFFIETIKREETEA